MTATLPTITVEAAKVRPGDIIDGRVVREVHSKPQSCTASYHSGGGAKTSGGHALPPLTFSCHVATIFFEDRGVPLIRWPKRAVEVQRP